MTTTTKVQMMVTKVSQPSIGRLENDIVEARSPTNAFHVQVTFPQPRGTTCIGDVFSLVLTKEENP